MKGNYTARAAACSLALSMLMAVPAAAQAGGQSLYLLSASPSGKYNSKAPVSIYQLGTRGSLALHTTLSTASADYILADPDDGLMAITYPAFSPRTVAAIRFGDAVEVATRSLDPAFASSTAEMRLLSFRGGAPPALAMILFDESRGFAPVSLARATEIPILPENRNCSYLVGGTFGLGESWSDAIQVTVHENILYPATPALARIPCTLALEAPPGISSDPDTPHFLTINSRRVAVVTLSDSEAPAPGHLGYRVDAILDKSSGQWRQLQIPGTLSRPRSFGDWIAYVVLDSRDSHAGNIRPETERLAEEGARAKVELDNSGWYIPGELYLVNTTTGAHHLIQTGQSDTEPLAITGTTLYFRVNASLYGVELGSSNSLGLADARLITSSPNLEDVHWAFMSY